MIGAIKLEQWLTIGYLTLVELAPRTPNKADRWVCRCVCGEFVVRSEEHLRYATTHGVHSHCGCKAPHAKAARARCQRCEGLGHRRPPEGCPGCGEPYVPEAPIRAVSVPRCGLGRVA